MVNVVLGPCPNCGSSRLGDFEMKFGEAERIAPGDPAGVKHVERKCPDCGTVIRGEEVVMPPGDVRVYEKPR